MRNRWKDDAARSCDVPRGQKWKIKIILFFLLCNVQNFLGGQDCATVSFFSRAFCFLWAPPRTRVETSTRALLTTGVLRTAGNNDGKNQEGPKPAQVLHFHLEPTFHTKDKKGTQIVLIAVKIKSLSTNNASTRKRTKWLAKPPTQVLH